MIICDLYEKILLDPAKQDADNLYIVSGYASPPMVEKHMKSIRDLGKNITIHLIIGMVGKGGITQKDHDKFRHIVRKNKSRFQCYYITKEHIPVHSKVYVWKKGKACKFGFSGSANYTLTGFSFKQQKEVMEVSPCEEALDYYNSMMEYGCPCVHADADRLVRDDAHVETLEDRPFTVSLLDKRTKKPHLKSCLNWGQRRVRVRKNEAYIGLRTDKGSRTNEFFPARHVPFTVHTDDGLVFTCSRRQDGGKAIHTPNNAHLGEYFRKRLKLDSSAPVTLDALVNYGRTDIEFYKIDKEEYYMDFSSRKP